MSAMKPAANGTPHLGSKRVALESPMPNASFGVRLTFQDDEIPHPQTPRLPILDDIGLVDAVEVMHCPVLTCLCRIYNARLHINGK